MEKKPLSNSDYNQRSKNLLPTMRLLLTVFIPLEHWITVPLSAVEFLTVRVETNVLNRGSEPGLTSTRTMWICAVESLVSPAVALAPENETGLLWLMCGSAIH